LTFLPGITLTARPASVIANQAAHHTIGISIADMRDRLSGFHSIPYPAFCAPF
jgi:hypothetical protein